MSVIARNKAILEEVLAGSNYAKCAMKFNVSLATVTSAIRSTIKLLREYTDIDIMETTSYDYIVEHQNIIRKALDSPMPKTTISPQAKIWLKNKFGKYFARDPARVAMEWKEICHTFNHFNERRDRDSIQKWLASEGFMVGNILTESMLNFAWESLEKALQPVNTEQEGYSFRITKVEKSFSYNRLIVNAEIGEKEHKSSRRFAIELIPG